jgi:hypothetical protein
VNYSSYNYKPLKKEHNHIRLITLLPNHIFRAPIHCELRLASLEEKPSYEALSYTWGDTQVKSSISLDAARFDVTVNLEAALRRLRLPIQQRTLWIDAICINQDDISERSHQVQQMRNIYENALQVVIWLGEGSMSATTEILLQAFAKYQEALEQQEIQVSKKGLELIASRLAGSLSDLEACREISTLLDSPWWSRVWTIQEVAVARKAVLAYGNVVIHWSTMEMAIPVLLEYCLMFNRDDKFDLERFVRRSWEFTRLEHLRDLTVDRKPLSLLHLLSEAWGLETSDPRDKVFALLHLATDGLHSKMTPDYSKSVDQVYMEVVNDLILRERNLDVLGRCGKPKNSQALPSWCPDWTVKTSRYKFCLSSLVERSTGPFCSAGNTVPAVTFSENFAVLSSLGIALDVIGTRDKTPAEDSSQTSDEAIEGWVSMGIYPPAPSSTHHANVIWVKALERTLYNDFNVYDGKLGSINAKKFSNSTFRKILLNRRKLFSTADGYLGICPLDATEGDLVCILLGGTVPFVLRAESDHWILIGEAYCKLDS